jgi:diguanylate cyclase (GGDEF)-like protein
MPVGSDSALPFIHALWFHTVTWIVGAVIVAAVVLRMGSARGQNPLQLTADVLARGWRLIVLTAAIVIEMGSLHAVVINTHPGVLHRLVTGLEVGVMCAVAAVAGLFVTRQFLAPPWWRLNAWGERAAGQTYGGTIPEIIAWIWRDAADTMLDLRMMDRLIVGVGVPAVCADAASVLGTGSMLVAAYTILLVLYTALCVALVTANRIPRVLMERLVELRFVARRISSGDLSARASASEHGEYEELNDLVSDLNSMARTLQARDAENQVLQHRLHAMLHQEQERATRDGLTQLRNRRYFNDALENELLRCARTGSCCSVGVLDLDNFKQVNDRFGHQEGDAVLQRMAYVLGATLRPYDLACRLGGEEFGVIFPETDALEARMVMDRLLEAMGAAGPNGAPQTFSGGIASYPRHAREMDALVRHADEAAYDAKLKGKARTVVYDPVTVQSMDSPQRQQEKMQADLVNTTRQLVTAVDAKESLSRDHSERTGRYAVAIARALGCDEDFCSRVYLCGLLHDVGKIGLDDSLMRKTGRLSAEELEQVRQHPEIGAQIVHNAGLRDVAVWVRHHHECWDGSGYPDGLAGEAIPLASRIVRVAEALETMTSGRVYRSASSVEQALLELHNGVGSEYDAVCVEALTWLVERGQLVVDVGEGTQPGLQASASGSLARTTRPPGRLFDRGSGGHTAA